MKKILILSANPRNTDWLRLDEEIREIKTALKRSKYRDNFEVITEGAVRIDDLRRALLDCEPQILHFSGHATANNNIVVKNNSGQLQQHREAYRLNSPSGGIALENNSGEMQLVSTKSLTDLFKNFQNTIECVLLNACYSEVQAEEIHKHIYCVIGMERSIRDDAAIKFAQGFYDVIGAGRNYEDAFQLGSNNIDLNGIPQSLITTIKINKNIGIIPSNNKRIFPNKKEKYNMTDKRSINIGTGNYNERIEGNYVQGNYYANSEKQSITEVAAEIQKILEQLDKSYPADTTLGKMQIAAETIKSIENNPSFVERILSASKAGGVQAFGQLLNHPAASFVIAALEDWQKTKGN
ncbi:CHAT domain-containing protein [Hassallia byssoidea VB512170]|uniref:CHAT domain-containing protein n=1 Tax=Hassallia byssoidea VB512170 TaxID=1304833 RepID=A0A846H439_9CYAN|nr:CHAT domain-containing protein [Hassalia byssoidea]NEU71360.1 CHAT domain-containing protein [Hassalia byssoidea VB512170]